MQERPVRSGGGTQANGQHSPDKGATRSKESEIVIITNIPTKLTPPKVRKYVARDGDYGRIEFEYK